MAGTIALVVVLALVAGSAAAQTISFVQAEKTVDQGSETTFDLVLDSAPKGLAGYEVNVSLDNPSRAVITSVMYPEWASLHKNSSFPADTVKISGVDLNKKVQNGSTSVLLATLTVQGDNPGTTGITIKALEVDADGGSPIVTTVKPGKLNVRQVASASTTGKASGSPTFQITTTANSSPEQPATNTSQDQVANLASMVKPYWVLVLGIVAIAGLSVLAYIVWMRLQ